MTAINEARFRAAEFWRNVFAVNPEHGTTLDDLMKPEYWAHVARQLHVWDRIEVRAEDGSYYAELLVREVGKTWAKVVPILVYTSAAIENPSIAIDGGYTVAFKGPQRRWSVIRDKDGAYIKDGFLDKLEAAKYAQEHFKAFAA